MTHPQNADHAAPNGALRDARLAQALKHMPDAHMQPSSQIRHAVLQAALRVASASSVNTPNPTPPTTRRWRNAWLGQPDRRVPWSAALASVALMGFITVLWYGQEVPPATSDSSPMTQKREATEKSAMPATPMHAAPAVAEVAASTDEPAKSMRNAAPQRLSRAEVARHAAKKMQAESDTPPVLTVVMGDVTRSLSPEHAQNLLTLLRALSTGASSDLPKRSDTQANFIVEVAGRERWLIGPRSVHHHLLGIHAKEEPASAGRSDITPTQYETLRGLAMETASPPLQ